MLSVLVCGPFLLHPPTARVLKNTTFPTVLAALLMALAASGDRIGWCFVIPLIMAPWIVWKSVQASHYTRLVSSEIRITGIIEMGVEEDILSGGGAVIYRPAPSTLEALRTARPEALRRRDASSSRHQTWEATPLPVHKASTGGWGWIAASAGLVCGRSTARCVKGTAFVRRIADRRWPGPW